MRRCESISIVLSLLVVSFFSVVSVGEEPSDSTGPLEKYVTQPDESYGWEVRRTGQLGRTSYVELTLTSQTWHDITWKHQLFILRPASAPENADHGMLVIAGGRWRNALAEPNDDSELPREAASFARMAEQIQSPIAVLLQVPHQPIFEGRYEDAAIAYTFEQFLRTGNDDWPLLLPMVKSAVAAMSAVQEYTQQEWELDLKTFTVTGASKRGWTTWLTGAVDPRVTAIAPMVIDMLNMAQQMPHQLEAWGAYSEQIEDYTRLGLQEQLATEEGNALREIVDPYSYRQQLTLPKLILLGTNDPYWTIDALNLYWDDLLGDKYILYVPNNGHSLRDLSRVVGSIAALHRHTAEGTPLPNLSWEYSEQEDETVLLSAESDVEPEEVRVWTATAPTRDFRDARWSSEQIDGVLGSQYLYSSSPPEEGFAAFFIEVQYEQEDALPAYFSTTVRILGE